MTYSPYTMSRVIIFLCRSTLNLRQNGSHLQTHLCHILYYKFCAVIPILLKFVPKRSDDDTLGLYSLSGKTSYRQIS